MYLENNESSRYSVDSIGIEDIGCNLIMNANDPHDIALVNHLIGHGRETEWLEFKRNQDDPEMIGKLCSALSNGARLHEHEKGYCIWGIEDQTVRVVGTAFDPLSKKVGNENFEFWLGKQFKPGIHIDPGWSTIPMDASY